MHHQKRFARKFAGRLLCGACLAVPLAPAFAAPDVNLNWGGYAKLALLFSHFQDGPVAQGASRNFYVPATIPVEGAGSRSDNYFDFQAKETRLFLKGDTVIGGHKIGGYVEMDFIVNPNYASANEPVTNAYNPGLRRAFVTYDNWLLGQDWSTFQNVAALPEVADFIGPTEGTVFVRQPLVRYTYGGLQVALENPETTLSPNTADKSATTGTDANSLPDMVLRYNFKLGSGDFSIAALGRQLAARPGNSGTTSADATIAGYGASLAAKVAVAERDDLRFMVSGGSGVGRYLAINTVGDGVADGNNRIDRSRIVDGFVAYRHVWDSQWRSTAVLSAFKASADSNYAGSVTKQVESASVNAMYSPVQKITFGAELRYARRTTMADAKGSLSRLEFMAKYDF